MFVSFACLLLGACPTIQEVEVIYPDTLTREQVTELVKEYNLPEIMVDIAWCESRFNRFARRKAGPPVQKHPEDSIGLFQINTIVWPFSIDELYDPERSMEAARVVLETKRGIRHWACFDKANKEYQKRKVKEEAEAKVRELENKLAVARKMLEMVS